MAIGALALGIISLIAWFLPLVGYPICIASIIVGIIALNKKQNRVMSILGIVGGSVGLTLTIINSVLGILVYGGF